MAAWDDRKTWRARKATQERMTPTTVTITYQRGDTTLARVVCLASADLVYDAPIPVTIANDEYGSELWLGFTLTNHTVRDEKRSK